MAAVLAFMLFGVVHNPDGPFVRPQPGKNNGCIGCILVMFGRKTVFLL